MKFFTFYEIINSLLAAAVYGILCGCLYRASACILTLAVKTLGIPRDIALIFRKLSLKHSFYLSRQNPKLTYSKIWTNLFDFITFLLFGIGLVFLYYVFLDGVFRIYVLLAVALGFLLAKSTVGKYFSIALRTLYSYVYCILLLFLGVFLLPFKRLFEYISKLARHIFTPFMEKIRREVSKNVLNRKKRQILSIKADTIFLTKHK